MTIIAASNAITTPTSHTESPAKHSSGSSSMAGRSVKPDNGGHVTLPSLRSSIYAGGVAVLDFFSQMQPGSATNATVTNYINQTANNAADTPSESGLNTGAFVVGFLAGAAMLAIGIGCYVKHHREAQRQKQENKENGDTQAGDIKEISANENSKTDTTAKTAVDPKDQMSMSTLQDEGQPFISTLKECPDPPKLASDRTENEYSLLDIDLPAIME